MLTHDADGNQAKAEADTVQKNSLEAQANALNVISNPNQDKLSYQVCEVGAHSSGQTGQPQAQYVIPQQAKIAVLIPCFNESQTIAKVVQDFKQVLPQATVYVFDNNSTDDSGRIALGAGAVVITEKRQGKGNVVRSMFRNIEADVYIMVDGDDTYDAQSAPEMVHQVLEQGVDMVIGDRLSSTYFSENKRRGHNVGNRLVRKLINTMFSVKRCQNVYNENQILDIMTGFRAFSYLFVKSFPVLSGGFEIETAMTVHALDKNFLISSMPIIYRDRPVGSVSKLNTVHDGLSVLWTILRLVQTYRPFFFFTLLALGCGVVSLAFLLPVFLEYFQTGLVERLPTMIAGCFSLLCAIFCIFTGLVLDVMTRQQRQFFELKLNELTHIYKEEQRKRQTTASAQAR